MTLPRFNSGSVGALSFSHLNEAFDIIEGVSPQSPPFGELADSLMVLAQLGQATSGAYQWAEVVLKDDGTYEPLVGGRSSSLAGDEIAAPAFALDGGSYTVGSTVLLTPKRTKEGKSWWAIVSSISGGPKAMILTGTGVSFGNGFWSYTARLANIQFTAQNVWTATPTGPEYVILNLAEFRTDTDGRIGMGTIPPNGVTSVRQPIRAGTVVIVHSIPGLTLGAFFAPNGYAFTCPSDGEP